MGRGAATATDKEGSCQWDSPSYERLLAHGLLRADWRKPDMASLDFFDGNATPLVNMLQRCMACFFPPLCCCLKTAEVPAGTIAKLSNGRGGFEWLGNRGEHQGVHRYWDMFYSIDPRLYALNKVSATEGLAVQNGDKWIVVVPQGFIGLATDVGEPVLLPPGMHQWQSATMSYERAIDLNQPVIQMGPYTLLTVDRGYEAVTQNNGRQMVLPGGAVHLLDHRNWKFEKFISTKIQTDDLHRIEVMTGDNVLMHVDATVCWSIHDAQRCAERAAETMTTGDKKEGTIEKLRNDVLKQAEASLSALVGKVNFSNTFSAATELAAAQAGAAAMPTLQGEEAAAPTQPEDAVALLFDVDKLQNAVAHANDMTQRYGVEVLSINIISAKPADNVLMQCLAKGAVAAAEAQQLETIARGRAKAATIDARGNADALKISAQADAEADVTRAEGSKQAAKLLEEQGVAVELAKISATGNALKAANSNLILGHDPSNMASMLMCNGNYTRDTLKMSGQPAAASG